MDPVTLSIIAGLARYVPDVIKWVSGSDKAADVAAKAIEIAKEVTGSKDGHEALDTLAAHPELAVQLKEKVLAAHLEETKVALEAIKEVNATMRAETTSEHWPSYSWRPFIGFSFGAYIISLWVLPLFKLAPTALTPDLTLAIGGILGVASWFRGKMQADPAVQSDMRG